MNNKVKIEWASKKPKVRYQKEPVSKIGKKTAKNTRVKTNIDNINSTC